MQYSLLLYLLLINAAGFLFMRMDKNLAKMKRWRIPESVLLFTALAGGSLGTLAAMAVFRHKTKKLHFRLLLPLFLALHIWLAVLLF